MTHHRNYCIECDWNASTENHDRHEVARRAIGHFKEISHTIESETIADSDTEQLSSESEINEESTFSTTNSES